MCGPFVLSQTRDLEKYSQLLLLPYHFGRITTYVLLAVLFNSVLNLAYLFSFQRALIVSPLLMVAGTLFLITAFPFLQKAFPWAANIRLPLPRRFIDKGMKFLNHVPPPIRPYLTGVLLGFIPCGLVTAALMASATATNMGWAALSMAAFGLGTMPTLIGIAFGGRALAWKYPRTAHNLSQGLIVWSGLWLFALAATLLM